MKNKVIENIYKLLRENISPTIEIKRLRIFDGSGIDSLLNSYFPDMSTNIFTRVKGNFGEKNLYSREFEFEFGETPEGEYQTLRAEGDILRYLIIENQFGMEEIWEVKRKGFLQKPFWEKIDKERVNFILMGI